MNNEVSPTNSSMYNSVPLARIQLFRYQVYNKSDTTTGTKTSIDTIDNKIIHQVLINDKYIMVDLSRYVTYERRTFHTEALV